jgi:HTH-type transcriptional regulator/antitoxin HigA
MHSLRPFRAITPAELIDEELKGRGWNIETLSSRAGLDVRVVEEIMRGERRIDTRMAARLSRALGTSREYWLNLESAHRADLGSNTTGTEHQDQE